MNEYLDEAFSVGVVFEDVMAFVAPAGYVVCCSGILNAEGSGHGQP